MTYSLNIGEWNSVFAVPTSVVDKYLKLASGNALKLLMFLLRHGGETFTADRLRAELNFNETGELEDAALFWVQRGVIRYSSEEEGKFSAAREGVDIRVEVQEEPAIINSPSVSVPKQEQKIKPISMSSGEIAARIKEDPDVAMLFSEAEKLYARPLRQPDSNAIISIVDHYGLPVGVALMLLQYCSKVNKLTPSYIMSVADNWQGDEILSIEKADSRIRSLEKQNSIEEQLHRTLEMTTAFTGSQKQYIHVWLDDWGFSEEMILLAITKTIDQIGKPKFNYANKILENWRIDGISTVEEANAPVAAKKSSDTNSSFDVDEVVAKIMNRYKG